MFYNIFDMIWIIIGIFIVMMLGLASLVRSLRLDGALKIVLSIFSVLSIALVIFALIGVINHASFTKVFFFIGLGVSIVTLLLAVHLLRKKHNKIFTDKTKEHHEHVAELLAKEKEKR